MSRPIPCRHRRSLAIVVLTILLLSGSASWAVDGDQQPARKADRIDRYLYGEPQSGGLAERLARAETDLLGRTTNAKPVPKAESVFNFLFKGSNKAPSLDQKLNFLEWKVFQETRQGKLGERVAALDTFVIGKASNEPLAFRVEQLIHLTIENGIISLHRVKVPAGTVIRLKLGAQLSSKSAQEGDEVPLRVAEDLFINRNILVVGKGGILSGELDKVKRGSRFGRSGYLKILINEISAIDSGTIPVKITGFGEDTLDKKKLGMAAGASALGYLVMGPVGLVGGAFIKGQDVTVPEGSEILVRTVQESSVIGVLVNRK